MQMESWSYLSEGKGLLFSDEMDIPVDAFLRSKKAVMGWDLKSSCNFDENRIISDREAGENMEIYDVGFPDMTRRPFDNLSAGMLNGEVNSDCNRRGTSACVINSTLSFGEDESGSKISSSLIESNSQDSSLIDLKLGRLTDCRNSQNGKVSKERSVVSSVCPSFPAKRARTASSCLQIPLCQVHGCNMDLSSSKDYHKRHKVCEVHSKTAKVIVNGIEQRFCQQCSRFHLLAEFDDGKRSCRKRLAGHNERRRKPQFHTLSGKLHKQLQSYQGTEFLGTSIAKGAAFLLPDIFPGGISFPERCGQANGYKHVKFEQESNYRTPFAISIPSEQSLQKSFLHVHDNVKQYGPGIPPSKTDGYTGSNTVSTIQEISGVSHSSCALSLLSAQSQDLSSQVAGIPTVRSSINQASHAPGSFGQNFDRPLGSRSIEKHIPTGFCLSGSKFVNVGHIGSVMVTDSGHAVDYEVPADGFFQESDFLNSKCCISPESGSTVDLLQLSSHLQRVQQQRNSILVKQENEDLCYFLTT